MTGGPIRVGDKTTGGGVVVGGGGNTVTDFGIPIVTRQDIALCCGGPQKFIEWCTGNDSGPGREWIIEGCKLTCGHFAISSDPTFSIEDTVGGGGGSMSQSARSDVITPMLASANPVMAAPHRLAHDGQPLTDYVLRYIYPDLHDTPVRDVSYKATLSNGECRVGTLSKTGHASLEQVAPRPVDVEYQHDAPDDDDDAIIDARVRVYQALLAIVTQTRIDFANDWKEWESAGTLKRRLLEWLNTKEGQVKGTRDWVVGTAETVWQAAVLLNSADLEVKEISAMVMTGQWEALDQKIADWRALGEKVLKQASEAKELVFLIFHDDKMQQMFPDFAERWWLAIPPDERQELQARFGTQIAIDLAISVLLAAFTAGSAGAAYGGAKWAASVGRVGAKVAKLLDELMEGFRSLAKVLRLRKRKLVETGRTADAGGVIESRWQGTVRGDKVDLPGVKTRKVDHTKRDRAEQARLLREFDSKDRKKFLQEVSLDSGKIKALKDAGLSDEDILKIQNGGVPKGWSAHHKLPLDDGGTNSIDNSVLMKEDPFHQAITNAQKSLTGSMPVGETKTVDWPEIPGFVYPPRP